MMMLNQRSCKNVELQINKAIEALAPLLISNQFSPKIKGPLGPSKEKCQLIHNPVYMKN